MKINCDGCGREWRIDANITEPSLVYCPHEDCRCSFLMQQRGDTLLFERARHFFRRRAAALRAQFSQESPESFADYGFVAGLLAVGLSMLSVAYWVSVAAAFFLSLAAFPWLFCVWNKERPSRGLLWAYLLAIFVVIAALTGSPMALAAALPGLLLQLLSSAFLVGLSAAVGGLFYRAGCFFLAHRFARKTLQQEKLSLVRIRALPQMMSAPYR
jgi:hypothetical protein